MLTFISIGSRACLICVLLLCECGAWLCPSPISSAIKDGVKRIQVSALDLSQNGLTYISNSTFSGIYLKLVNLSLANNLLLCVGQDSFSGLAVLERLDLSGNNLSHIHVNTFSCNLKLYWLSLADNKLFTLPPQEGINNVIYLNMSHNSIFNIQRRSFRPLNQLRCLDISFNDLSSLDVDVFINNTNIIGYNSSEGCETWLETEYTLPVVKLKADNNPWHCNCAMKILFDYVSEHNSSSLDLTCKEPARLENTSWKELKHLDCTTTSTATAVRLVTEESTVHIRMFTPTTPVSNSSEQAFINILILLLTVFVVICAVLIVYIYKLRKQQQLQQQMRVDAGMRHEEEEEDTVL